ncbi:hypothetical protein [Brevibacillus laterosporus]|uniref:hypothetical protein n=1 Tax=Brevibacillus laterosporus TaxID=1465 RepID=UPI000B9C29FF|nr:hypothetical protein [Brevibacillus laterosporus]MBG9789182.1 hypothetical protein [Brevibacillus laterosporus]
MIARIENALRQVSLLLLFITIMLSKWIITTKPGNANDLLTEMKSSFVPNLEGKGIRLEIEAENISIFDG